jgi:hypothetical protein
MMKASASGLRSIGAVGSTETDVGTATTRSMSPLPPTPTPKSSRLREASCEPSGAGLESERLFDRAGPRDGPAPLSEYGRRRWAERFRCPTEPAGTRPEVCSVFP